MFLTINSILGVLFAISLLSSDVTSESSLANGFFPVLSTILFLYFLCYGVFWMFERKLFPDAVRPSDYLEGKVPPLDAMPDEDTGEGFPDDREQTPPPY